MKKINKLILLLIMILTIPQVVGADVGAYVPSYEVIISNKNGAPVYDCEDTKCVLTNEVIPYDTICEVIYEEYYSKEMYLTVSIYDDVAEEWQESKIIKAEDARAKKYDLEEFKNDDKIKLYILEEGNYLYKGPSKIYGKLDNNYELEKETTIETIYYDNVWAYVKQNGNSGWVYIDTGYMSGAGPEYSPTGKYSTIVKLSIYKEEFIALEDIIIYDSVYLKIKTGNIIKKNAKFTAYSLSASEEISNEDLYYIDNLSKVVSLTYDNSAIICTPSEEDDCTIKIENEDVHLFKESLPQNEALAILWDSACQIDNKYCSGNNRTEEEQEQIDIEEKKIIEELINKNAITTIKLNKEFTYNYFKRLGNHGEILYHVTYNGKTGWITANEALNKSEETEESEETEDSPQSSSQESSKEFELKPTTEKEKYNTDKNTAIYYIVFTSILALTIFVTIVLINKKKKEKK